MGGERKKEKERDFIRLGMGFRVGYCSIHISRGGICRLVGSFVFLWGGGRRLFLRFLFWDPQGWEFPQTHSLFFLVLGFGFLAMRGEKGDLFARERVRVVGGVVGGMGEGVAKASETRVSLSPKRFGVRNIRKI